MLSAILACVERLQFGYLRMGCYALCCGAAASACAPAILYNEILNLYLHRN